MRARTHISLPVSNVKNSVEFYSRMFKTQPTKLKEDYANFRLECPLALHLALVETPGLAKKTFENTNGQHFGIELFDDKDLQEWKKLVEGAGITPHLEEEQVTETRNGCHVKVEFGDNSISWDRGEWFAEEAGVNSVVAV